jgi:hypothetical protein
MEQTSAAVDQTAKVRAQIKEAIARVGQGATADQLTALDKKIAAVGGPGRGEAGSPGIPGGAIDLRNPNLTSLNGAYASQLENLQSADLRPTSQQTAAGAELKKALAGLLSRWDEIRSKDMPAVNSQLKQAGQKELVF